MWTVIISIVKKIFTAAWLHKNIAAYVILGGIIAFLTCSRKDLKKQIDIAAAVKTGLPDNVEFKVSLNGTKFITDYRDSKGAAIHKEYYIPQEGKITIVKYIDLKKYDANSGLSGGTVVNGPKIPSVNFGFNPFAGVIGKIFHNGSTPTAGTDITPTIYGFTFRPGMYGVYDNYSTDKPFNIGIDAKLLYVSRFSMGIGSTINSPSIWASYHIDQFVPLIEVNNAELMLLYERPYNDFGRSMLGIGLRSNL